MVEFYVYFMQMGPGFFSFVCTYILGGVFITGLIILGLLGLWAHLFYLP